jgi:hypothetical protein
MVSSVDGLAATGLENRNVRFGSKADIEARQSDGRFTPESGHCHIKPPRRSPG